ncbi:TonB-dependent receptor [Fulvivirgaceae bacterium BMA12]|uniref:TonB-dependent receptor n=1 Tax=Agaribacillus aureus TaxID=3051825 RepID=A0ABT8KYB3_9BACT|nr:TonB-dependent receptor [Fulvivirgaceae bacterium BMA12]
MSIKPEYFVYFLVFILSITTSVAQNGGVEITGTIIDTQSKQPVEHATITIKDSKTQNMITGTVAGEKGDFSITTDALDIYVEVSFIGYKSNTIKDISVANGKVALGTILLSEDKQLLDEIMVVGERSTTEFQLDKRVFNVGKDISSTGMSALEVLNNVPSVNVNIEGQISLRGSTGAQIMIDGKPSVLADEQSNALGTITADMIEKIEVITNPSAKYDAEGTSGIINIVLKKEEKKGLNGSISVNTGTPDNHSVGISLNRRTEKFNLFAQLGAGYRSLPRESESINTDLNNNTTVNSGGTSYRNETFYNVILGTDYHIDAHNVVTLSGNFAYEIEDQPSSINFSFLDDTNSLVSAWRRDETTEATNPKWQYDLQYSREFKDNEEHTLLFNALGRFFGKDQASEFENTNISGTEIYNDQQTETKFQQADYTFKLDYTRPFTDKIKIETGAQYVINDVGNDYAVRDLVEGEWIPDDDLTNNFEYDQKVLGLYGTGAYEGDKWGIKLGLRMENTNLNTLLTNTNEANSQDYVNLFPSAHTSYKFTELFSLQAGYSRRIYRPRLWDLNPFFNIRNNFNIRTGNPDLQPEFTDSYEVTGIFVFGKASLNAGVYHRYVTDVIERVSRFEDNVNTTTPLNIGTDKTTGFEVNAKYDPVRWLAINGDLNYNQFNREGDFENQSFDFEGDRWTSRLTTKFKLPAQFDLEITGNYESGYQTVQSQVADNAYGDIGVRKKMMEGKAVINFAVRDIFASRIQKVTTEQPGFSLYNEDFRGRFVTLGFSYGFGKGEAMTYSGGRRR